MKLCRDSRCSLEGTRRVGELLGVARRVSGTVSHFRVKHGTSLRRCSGQGPHLAKTLEPRGFSRVAAGFSSDDGDYRLPPLLALGSPVFHSSCQGELRGNCSRVTAGQNRPHLDLCPGPNVPLLGRQRSRHCILDSPGESGLVSRGSQGHCSPVKLRRVYLGAHCVA